ncbi:hypothetical protein NT6N_03510 [Oceaniferula spumae]|uniref:Bacterial sugar transferase domain-containing protein n=1 Tax=Oceaniferula spumae TaxID=2979115 RepID=A0AAT9FH50_9BACT
MSSSPFQLESIDRAYARFASISCARVIVGRLNEKFWSLAFLIVSASSCLLAFELTPSADSTPPSVFIVILTSMVFGVSFTACSHVLGLTNHLLGRNIIPLAIKLFFCSIIGAVAVSMVIGFMIYQPIGRYVTVIAMLLATTCAFVIRSGTWLFSSSYMPKISLIGDKQFCEEAIQFLQGGPLPLKIQTLSLREQGEDPAFVQDFNASSYPISLPRLCQRINSTDCDHIVYQPAHWAVLEQPLVEALAAGKTISPFSQYVEEHYQTMPTWQIPNSGLFSKSFANSSPSYLMSKRVCDIILAIVGLLFSLPLLVMAAIAIKLEDGGPVFYNQIRVGRYGRHFTIYKLRSMCVDSETGGAKWASKSDSRITRIGKFLRRSRIDELPQFLNILRGDMSFIGPRPERPEFTSALDEELHHYNLRHLLKPGLTGWAQINYPYGDSIEDAKQKLTYDLYYVKYATLALDLQIALRTVGAAMQGAR